MKKNVYFDENALAEFRHFDNEVQKEFHGHFSVLKEKGRLEFPNARKIGKNLFEIRVQYHGTYRGCYAYVEPDAIMILHCFQKKTQKMPLRNIETAYKRLKKYEQ